MGTNPFTATDDRNGNLVGNSIIAGSKVVYDGFRLMTNAIIFYRIYLPLQITAADQKITVEFTEDFGTASSLSTITSDIKQKSVTAYPYTLNHRTSVEQMYMMAERFGINVEDRMLDVLIGLLNQELSIVALNKITEVLPVVSDGKLAVNSGNTGLATIADNASDTAKANNASQRELVYYKTQAPGISYNDHKREFLDALARADQTIAKTAGMGMPNVYIMGSDACAIVSTFPEFETMNNGNALGIHYYGNLKGKPVVRVSNPAIFASDEVLALYRGEYPFDAPVTVCPYMPITDTGLLPVDENPLERQRAIVSWTAVESIIPNYSSRIKMVNGRRTTT